MQPSLNISNKFNAVYMFFTKYLYFSLYLFKLPSKAIYFNVAIGTYTSKCRITYDMKPSMRSHLKMVMAGDWNSIN